MGEFRIEEDIIKLSNGKQITIYPNEEEEDLILRIDDVMFSGSSKYDTKLDKNKKFIIKVKSDPKLLEPFLIHRNHYYKKDKSTEKISKDLLFPGIILLKNEKNKDEIRKKIEDEKPIKREELKNRLKENLIDKIVDAGLDMFSWNLIIGEKLMQDNEKLRHSIQSAAKTGRVNLKKIREQIKEAIPEDKSVFENKDIEKSFEELAKLSPILLNDILSLWIYEELEDLIDFSLSLTNKNCLKEKDYEKIIEIVEKLEKYDLINPMLTLSMCCKPNCEYQSISNNKIESINCPNCKSPDSLFSAIVYKFDEFVEDLIFGKKLLPDHSYISYLIAHYLHFFSEESLDVYPLRYVSVKGAEKNPEEIDVLTLTNKIEPIIFECKLHRDRSGDYDKIKSSCKNGIKQLKKKMDYIGSTEGYLITNFTNKTAIEKINNMEKTKEKGINVLHSGEIIEKLNNIIKNQSAHIPQIVSN